MRTKPIPGMQKDGRKGVKGVTAEFRKVVQKVIVDAPLSELCAVYVEHDWGSA